MSNIGNYSKSYFAFCFVQTHVSLSDSFKNNTKTFVMLMCVFSPYENIVGDVLLV